jgi:CheY-like chemotaxis protein
MQADRDRGHAVGMDGYVVKPIALEALLLEMERVLGAARPAS